MNTSLRPLAHGARSRAPFAVPPLLLFVASIGVVGILGCSGPADPPVTAEEAPASEEAAAADEGAVEYQPAFPAEVSDAPLEASDIDQHEAAHAAGDHEHGEGGHTHDGESDHSHGDGDHEHGDDEDHEHGDDSHSH